MMKMYSNDTHPQITPEPDFAVRHRERIVSMLNEVRLPAESYSRDFMDGFGVAMQIAIKIANTKMPY